MRINNYLLLASMTALLAITASAADVAGKWVGQMPTRNGDTREATFNLKADGDKLTGTMSGPGGDIEIKDGKVSGNDISFKVPLEFNGNSFVLIFKGTISGDQIKFTRGREGAEQTQEFTAKRAS